MVKLPFLLPFGALERAEQRSQIGREAGARLGLARLGHVLHRVFDCRPGRFQRRLGRGLRAGVAASTRAKNSAICASSYLILDSLERAASTDSPAPARSQQDSTAGRSAQQDNTGWDIVSAGAVQIGPCFFSVHLLW